MNHSIYGADRTTHLKIVAVALAASIGLTSFVISTRISAGEASWQGEQITQLANPLLSCCEGDNVLCPT